MTGATKEDKDTIRTQPIESTEWDSWGLTEIRDPVRV